jgi:hypothetical protein
MWALPPNFGNTQGLQVTGLSCPDCDGVLQVGVAEPDSGFLQFVCRIGHSFSLSEVIAAKEAAIENALRSSEVAFAEIIALLDDLEREDVPARISGAERTERRARLERHLALVRTILEQNQPLDLGTGSAREPSDPTPEPG